MYPILVDLGVWQLRSYGVFVALAIVAGVVFVGVNIQDKEDSARAFLEEFGITYPNGMDRGARIAIDDGVWGLPETFVIDRGGRITYKHVGGLGWQTISTKLEEAMRGVVSASEGRGEYQSSR